ncbi:HU family DNA-binding protein [Microlunatus soli]|uniref:DNA-binding protein HU-beta n=1 Tax=Microlunatus soli TaxID=630515 RepID=A0A1H1MXR6_9ACTN|nr:HU family DNA-binding protein [Microlunatus soli]SDR91398.1 DNA-binding protein HU-beta [Microlunatus soli]
MNRTELNNAIAAETGVDRDTVSAVLDALDAQLVAAAAAGGEVRWPGLLTLDVTERPSRTGRNPRTGEQMEIPAGKSVRLRPGTRLKSAAR